VRAASIDNHCLLLVFELERSYGSMSRSILLPENADFEHINAAYENGVLTLNIPKLATPKSNKKFIDIN
jgi:HSP20 family protein